MARRVSLGRKSGPPTAGSRPRTHSYPPTWEAAYLPLDRLWVSAEDKPREGFPWASGPHSSRKYSSIPAGGSQRASPLPPEAGPQDSEAPKPTRFDLA